MNFLDLRTVLLSDVISDAICTVVVLSLWFQNRRRSPALGYWLIDYIIQFVAVLLIVSRGVIPESISILLGVPLIIGGTLLLYIGLERYVGSVSAQAHNYLLLAAITSVHGYFAYVQPSLQARNINLSLGMAALFAQCSWLLLRRADADLRPATRPVGMIFVAYTLVSLARVIMEIVVPPGNNLFSSGPYAALVILTYQMLFVALTFSLLLMVNRRLFADLERDLAERRDIAEALRENEANLVALIDNTDSSIWSIDPDYRLITGNHVFLQNIRAVFDREVVRGESVFVGTMDPQVYAEWRSYYDRALRGEQFKLEIKRRLAEQPRWMEYRFSPIRAEGRVLGVTVLGRDITEDKHAEVALRHLSAIVELSDDAIIGKTLEGTIISWNVGAERLYGYTSAEIMGQSVSLLLPSGREDDLSAILERIRNGESLRNIEITRQAKDGHIVDVSLSISPIRMPTGEIVGAATIARDIGERRRIEAAEREQRALAEALRDTAAALSSTLALDDVLDRILDNVGRVVPHDAASIMLVEGDGGMAMVARSRGYVERGADTISGARYSLATTSIISQMACTGRPVAVPDIEREPAWERRSAQSKRWIRSYAGAPIRMRDRVIGFINLDSATPGFFSHDRAERLLTFADQAAIAIENARLYAEVHELAITDSLTGVFNRRGLFQIGEREVERALRFHTQLAMVMLDVDHFKRINDTYGHPIGDRVLHALASLCRGTVRSVDLVARYGGEEFALLLPETDLASAAQVAERLRRAVELLEVSEGLERRVFSLTVSLTVSLGVSALTPDTSDLAALIARADKALYAAKRSGRNRVVVSE